MPSRKQKAIDPGNRQHCPKSQEVNRRDSLVDDESSTEDTIKSGEVILHPQPPAQDIINSDSLKPSPRTRRPLTYWTLPAEVRQLFINQLLDWDFKAATSTPQAFDRFLSPEQREQGIKYQMLRERLTRIDRLKPVLMCVSVQFKEDLEAMIEIILGKIIIEEFAEDV
jgi:hypothetical protein